MISVWVTESHQESTQSHVVLSVNTDARRKGAGPCIEPSSKQRRGDVTEEGMLQRVFRATWLLQAFTELAGSGAKEAAPQDRVWQCDGTSEDSMAWSRAGVSNSFSWGGHISLVVAFKGPNVIFGLCKCNYSLTRGKELSAAAGEKQGGGPDSGHGPWVCRLWSRVPQSAMADQREEELGQNTGTACRLNTGVLFCRSLGFLSLLFERFQADQQRDQTGICAE